MLLSNLSRIPTMNSSVPRPITAPLFLALLLTAACTADEQAQAGAGVQAPAQPTLEAATSLGVRNARMPAPALVTAGQITEEQFDGLVAAGFENFISLRLADEDGAGWEEGHAPSEGVSFTRLPVTGGAGLTRETAEELAWLLDSAEGGTVLYCGSSNRVGALMALKAFWVDGAEPQEALDLGLAAGMTRLEPTVRGMLGLSEN